MVKTAEIPAEYLTALGTVLVKWNHFEGVLDLVLIKLLGKNPWEDRGYIIFAHVPFNGRLDVLRALMVSVTTKTNSPKTLERFKKEIEPRISSISKRRNTFVHAKWGIKEGHVVRVEITARNAFSIRDVKVTLKEINQLATDISDTMNALLNFVQKDPAP